MLIHGPSPAWLGRRKTLLVYTLIFVVGAVRDLIFFTVI